MNNNQDSILISIVSQANKGGVITSMDVIRTALLLTLCATIVVVGPNLLAQEIDERSEIQAREDLILGKPPRIAPLDASALDGESQRIVEEVWQALGIPPKDNMPAYFLTMLKHPELMLGQAKFSIRLFQGALSVRDRELAILRLAWLCQAPYEWGQHVNTGKRTGLTGEEIEGVTVGSASPLWSQRERAILRAVEELHSDAMIGDETWRALAGFLDEKQLIELPVLVGYYQSIAYLQNSLRFRLESDNSGLSER